MDPGRDPGGRALACSTVLRVVLVVIAAAVLTGLVQHYWSFDSGPPEPAKPVARAPAAPPSRRPEPASPPARPLPAAQAALPQPSSAPPPPSPAEPLRSEPPEPSEAPTLETRNAALVPTRVAPEPAQAQPQPAPRPPSPQPALPAEANAQPAEDGADVEATDPRAVDLVDLNTGSLGELNGLKGGGAIGRAIIQHRPYASTDQLLSKRVLSRAIYQRIKDQVTVR